MRRSHSLIVAAALSVAFSSSALAQIVVDGTLDAAYGAPLGVQTVNTGFGDNQSELNAAYYRVEGGKLHVFIAGNLESNFNKLIFFFDTKAGGQNVMRTDNPDVNFNNLNSKYGGMTFDAGFSPDYWMSFTRGNDGNGVGNLFVDFSELNTNGGGLGGFAGNVAIPTSGFPQQGSGTIGGSGGFPLFSVGYDDSNTAGVTGDAPNAADPVAAAAVTTGMEIAFDLDVLDIQDEVKLFVGINGQNHDYWSNQFLPGLAAPQGNLGGDGAGGFNGTVGQINFANITGDQFVTLNIPPTTFNWVSAAGGNWNSTSNWSSGLVPNGPSARANLVNHAGPQTINLDTSVTVARMTIDSAGAYTIAGPGTLTLNGSSATPAIEVVNGDHLVAAPVVLAGNARFRTAAGTSLTINSLDSTSRDIFKDGDGTVTIPATPSNSISVNAGRLEISGSGNSVVRGVTIDSTGTLDIGVSSLLVDYDDGFSPITTLLDYAAAGNLVGDRAAIGWLDSAQTGATSFNGTDIDATTLVLRSTLLGDTDLDLTVGFNDLLSLAQNYDPNGTGKVWAQGDFDRDGTVGFTDLLALAQNYGRDRKSVV